MRGAAILIALAALVATAPGCSPSFGDGDFICTDAQPGCPDGYRCIEGRCRLGSASTDAAADAPADAAAVECPFPSLFASAENPGMIMSSLAFDTSMFFWRFQAPAGFCVTELGVGMSLLEDGATVTLALFDLSDSDEVPDRFSASGPRYEQDVTPGRILSITEVSATADPAFCLDTVDRTWWAVAAWSNDPNARPSSGHARFIGDTRQPAYKRYDDESVVDAVGSRLHVSGCVP